MTKCASTMEWWKFVRGDGNWAICTLEAKHRGLHQGVGKNGKTQTW